jgi:hypothetical protein
MSQSKHGEPAGRAPSSGRGASSALEAMVRKRILAPGTQAVREQGKDRSAQAAPKQRS